MIYLILFIEFIKIGLLAIGGGIAAIPFLQEISQRRGWFSEQELISMIVVSESTPGPIGVNMATFAGFKAAGISGGITATLTMILPSVVIIPVISRFMKRYENSRVAAGTLKMLRAAAGGLIAGAALPLFMLTVKNTEGQFGITSIAMFAVLTVLCFFTEFKARINPVFIIALGGFMGLLFGHKM